MAEGGFSAGTGVTPGVASGIGVVMSREAAAHGTTVMVPAVDVTALHDRVDEIAALGGTVDEVPTLVRVRSAGCARSQTGSHQDDEIGHALQ